MWRRPSVTTTSAACAELGFVIKFFVLLFLVANAKLPVSMAVAIKRSKTNIFPVSRKLWVFNGNAVDTETPLLLSSTDTLEVSFARPWSAPYNSGMELVVDLSANTRAGKLIVECGRVPRVMYTLMSIASIPLTAELVNTFLISLKLSVPAPYQVAITAMGLNFSNTFDRYALSRTTIMYRGKLLLATGTRQSASYVLFNESIRCDDVDIEPVMNNDLSGAQAFRFLQDTLVYATVFIYQQNNIWVPSTIGITRALQSTPTEAHLAWDMADATATGSWNTGFSVRRGDVLWVRLPSTEPVQDLSCTLNIYRVIQ
jgi:hypothetical protein